jgi:hypothetical protein
VAPGRIFTAGTDTLLPGWTLVLPADATVAGSSTVVVVPGDSLSGIASRVYRDPDRWPDLWEANRGRRFNDRTFDDPNLIRPGWDLVVPADPSPPAPSVEPTTAAPAPQPAASTTAPSTAAGPSTAPPVSTTSASTAPAPPFGEPASPSPSVATRPTTAPAEGPASSGSRAEEPGWVAPAGVAGAVLLATGVAGVVASRRRRRLREMGPEDALPPVDPDLAPVERAVRLGDDALGMARVDTALRAVLARLDGAVPRPHLVIRHATDDIELVFDQPVQSIPSPWRATGWPERILLPASVTIEELAADAVTLVAPCPGVVLLGTTDDAELYADIEALEVITLDGPPETTAALARAFVATLAVSPLADLVHIVASGVDCYGFADEERVHAVPSRRAD